MDGKQDFHVFFTFEIALTPSGASLTLPSVHVQHPYTLFRINVENTHKKVAEIEFSFETTLDQVVAE